MNELDTPVRKLPKYWHRQNLRGDRDNTCELPHKLNKFIVADRHAFTLQHVICHAAQNLPQQIYVEGKAMNRSHRVPTTR